jgi:branched-chain amino acid transport system ATP-binding protein
MLEVRDLHVSYGRVPALRGTALRVDHGEIVGLIGHNGAGKTTTLASICGATKPRAGSIGFEGEQLIGRAPEQIVRSGIALVPEGRRIFSRLSVRENLSLGAASRRGGRAAIATDIEEQFARFPVLEHYADARAGNLSGGEQQQLAIARALMSKPRLLLLDEPSLGLAPLIVDLVFEILVQLRDEGMTVLLVEQNAARTVDVADRTYVLRPGGQVEFEGTAAELHAIPDFDTHYLGLGAAQHG